MMSSSDGLSPAPPVRRFYSLDAIRGIAALVVVLSHGYTLLPKPIIQKLGWLYHTPLRPFINSEAAVVTFFVLSGFVLSLPYATRAPGYKSFFIRRMFRIYVPYVICLVLACLLYAACNPDAVSENSLWIRVGTAVAEPPIFTLFLLALLMPGSIDGGLLNPPSWTLAQEMRISLILPLMMKTARTAGMALILALGFFLIAAVFTPLDRFTLFPVITDNFPATFWVTVFYIPCFYVGISVTRQLAFIQTKFAKAPCTLRQACWLICFFCFFAFNDYGHAGIINLSFMDRIFFYTCVAGILIALTISSPSATWFLERPLMQFFGRISYSLYLVHIPILMTTRHVLTGQLPDALILILGIGVSITAAAILNRFVEIPSMQLGHKLAKT